MGRGRKRRAELGRVPGGCVGQSQGIGERNVALPCLLLNECQEMARNLLQEGSLVANTSPDAKKHRETIPWCHEPCLLFRVLAAQSIRSDPGQGRDLSAELIEAFKILDEDADGQRPSDGEDVKLRTGANTAKRTG